MEFLPGGEVEGGEGEDEGGECPWGAAEVEGVGCEEAFELGCRLKRCGEKVEEETYCGVYCVTAVVEHLTEGTCHARSTCLFPKSRFA